MLMGEIMKEASFSLAEAKFTTGDFNHIVLQNVNKAQIKVRSKKDNVAGEFINNCIIFFTLGDSILVSRDNWNPYNLKWITFFAKLKFSLV